MPAWALFLLFSIVTLTLGGLIVAASMASLQAIRARLLMLAVTLLAGYWLLITRVASGASDGKFTMVAMAILGTVSPPVIIALMLSRWHGGRQLSLPAALAVSFMWLGLAMYFGARLACQMDALCDV